MKAFSGKNIYFVLKKTFLGLDVVAHTCNPSYSGGGNQEDHS
jgi:hypothetical protein